MRRIDSLLLRAITPPLLITFAVLTFVVSVHEFGTLSELLITRNVSFGVLLRIIAAILPDILIYSLPLSFLIGILIGLGGLSGESQILALRACGVPLRSMLRCILLLGAGIGILTAIISIVVLPKTNDLRRQVVDRISLSVATSQIQARVFNEDFPNRIFYLNDLSGDRQRWSGIFLADNSDPKSPRIMLARAATWIPEAGNRRLQLHLEQGASYSFRPEDPGKDTQSVFDHWDIPIELQKNSAAARAARKPKEQSTPELWRNSRTANPEDKVKYLVELNRRISLPFAIFPFAILGLSLAISTPKSGRTLGFALSLATVVVFYMLFANGIRLASVGKVSPWLGAWSANLILVLMGWFLLVKVEKRFALSHWSFLIPWKSRGTAPVWRLRFGNLRSRIARLDNAILQSCRRLIGFCVPRILDLHILRGFLVYFLWSLATCATLFLLLTLFELLDDVIRNNIPILDLIEYLVFLTPQILLVAIPMAVLLGILINFGILEKESEITAIKASGWSLYRVAVPVFLMALALSMGLFLMQEHILPHANDRQDSLRNFIQNKPPRTSKRLQRKWIFGESGRIYNYEYFDSNQDAFIDLSVYEIDLERSRILRRIHAARATIGPNGDWRLENGWMRDYRAPQGGFMKIATASLRFPEPAAYFKREIFQPRESSKLTYGQLRQYIRYLKQTGYNAMELQVELDKKIAFPVSCLIMALLGVPFAFSVGKRGAFYGIGTSIAIAIAYWGIASAFEAMGSYGMLLPALAAWAPNVLFGAAGVTLFLTIRT